MFGGLAISAANATESETLTVQPTEAAAPVVVAETRTRTPRVNPDGSMTVDWLDTARDEANLNYPSFENLSVTVSQVQDLTYQAVSITWEGGVETTPRQLAANFLQIMQCWDDGSGTADPTNCQWGAAAGANISLLGANAMTRSLGYEGEDPAQDYTGKFDIKPPLGQFEHTYAVPFETAPSSAFPNGQSTQDVNRYFDATSTNEIAGVRTTADGTGETTFEIQTSLESPHLGCGATTPDGDVRDCWLVVVPRGEYGADGTYYQEGANGRLMGSPLSQSNWDNRIEFPLDFRSVESGCPIGASEKRTTGNEMVAPAFASWQAAMCAKKKVFGFSLIGDGESRRNIVSETDGAARLAFVDNPLSETEAAGSTIVYAPAVKTALTVAFNINYFIKGGSDLEYKDGQQVSELVLNPRLIAKLLTQSYTDDVPNGINQSYLSTNPINLRHDPEFLELNPEFEEFVNGAAPTGLMVPLGNADVFAQLWTWLKSDSDANAFLAGTADDWGMVVNRYYRNLDINNDATISSFPKADLTTFAEYDYIPEPGYGTFELRPYVADLHDGGVRAYRGDAGSKTFWDTGRSPAAFTSDGAQLLGRRFMLTVTDLVTAERLGLKTAKLVNPSGEAVSPTTTAIESAVSEFVDSNVPGFKVSTSTLTKEGSYPLATLTYAAVDVCRATLKELSAYKSLLSFIAGSGQTIGNDKGEIPAGYVPLSDEEVALVKKSISVIAKEIANPVCAQHIESPNFDTTDVIVPSPTITSPETPVDSVVENEAGKYASDSQSALRYSMLSAMCFGLPMIVGGRTLIRKAKSL